MAYSRAVELAIVQSIAQIAFLKGKKPRAAIRLYLKEKGADLGNKETRRHFYRVLLPRVEIALKRIQEAEIARALAEMKSSRQAQEFVARAVESHELSGQCPPDDLVIVHDERDIVYN